jgi:hypothetical protein
LSKIDYSSKAGKSKKRIAKKKTSNKQEPAADIEPHPKKNPAPPASDKAGTLKKATNMKNPIGGGTRPQRSIVGFWVSFMSMMKFFNFFSRIPIIKQFPGGDHGAIEDLMPAAIWLVPLRLRINESYKRWKKLISRSSKEWRLLQKAEAARQKPNPLAEELGAPNVPR